MTKYKQDPSTETHRIKHMIQNRNYENLYKENW